MNINEWHAILTFMASQGVPTKQMNESGGLFINRNKYRMARYMDDIKALYLSGKGGNGGCLQYTANNKIIVFGSYNKSKGQTAGKCNMAVEKVCAALSKSGY